MEYHSDQESCTCISYRSIEGQSVHTHRLSGALSVSSTKASQDFSPKIYIQKYTCKNTVIYENIHKMMCALTVIKK